MQWEIEVFLTEPPGRLTDSITLPGEFDLKRTRVQHRFGSGAALVAHFIQSALNWDTTLYESLKEADWQTLRCSGREGREYRGRNGDLCLALLRRDPRCPRPFLEKVAAPRERQPGPQIVLEAISDVLTGQAQGWDWLWALHAGSDGQADAQRSFLRKRFALVTPPSRDGAVEVCLRDLETGNVGFFNLLDRALHHGEGSGRFGLIDTFARTHHCSRFYALQELLADWLSLEQKELLCWAASRPRSAERVLDTLRIAALETAPEQFHLAAGPKTLCASSRAVLESAHLYCPFDLRFSPLPAACVGNGLLAGLSRVIGSSAQQQILAAAEQMQVPGYYPLSTTGKPEDAYVDIRSSADLREEWIEWNARRFPGILRDCQNGWFALTADAQTHLLAAQDHVFEVDLRQWRHWLEENALPLGGQDRFHWSMDWELAGVLRNGQKGWCVPYRLAAEALRKRNLPAKPTSKWIFWPYLPTDGRYPFHLLLELAGPLRYMVIGIGIGISRQGKTLEPFRLESGPSFNVLPVMPPQGPIVLNG